MTFDDEKKAQEIAQVAATIAVSRAKDNIADAVKTAMEETLTKFGFDVEHPLEMQQDFQYIRATREATDEIKKKAILTMVGIFITGLLGLLWVAFKGNVHS